MNNYGFDWREDANGGRVYTDGANWIEYDGQYWRGGRNRYAVHLWGGITIYRAANDHQHAAAQVFAPVNGWTICPDSIDLLTWTDGEHDLTRTQAGTYILTDNMTGESAQIRARNLYAATVTAEHLLVNVDREHWADWF